MRLRPRVVVCALVPAMQHQCGPPGEPALFARSAGGVFDSRLRTFRLALPGAGGWRPCMFLPLGQGALWHGIGLDRLRLPCGGPAGRAAPRRWLSDLIRSGGALHFGPLCWGEFAAGRGRPVVFSRRGGLCGGAEQWVFWAGALGPRVAPSERGVDPPFACTPLVPVPSWGLCLARVVSCCTAGRFRRGGCYRRLCGRGCLLCCVVERLSACLPCPLLEAEAMGRGAVAAAVSR
jgi:hypothetical protein